MRKNIIKMIFGFTALSTLLMWGCGKEQLSVPTESEQETYSSKFSDLRPKSRELDEYIFWSPAWNLNQTNYSFDGEVGDFYINLNNSNESKLNAYASASSPGKWKGKWIIVRSGGPSGPVDKEYCDYTSSPKNCYAKANDGGVTVVIKPS